MGQSTTEVSGAPLPLPPRHAARRVAGVALVLGNETDGLSETVRPLLGGVSGIPGAVRLPRIRGNHDLQRARSPAPGRSNRRGVQFELEFALPPGQPPTRDSLERLHTLLVMRRSQVFDVACPTPRACTIWIAVAPDPVRTVRM